MTYLDCLEILKQNFCKSGETDENGLYRHWTLGNRLYLVNNKGGWCFIYPGNTHNMYKFSIKANGETKNGGKFRDSDLIDLDKVLQKSTKYAIQTPQEWNDDKPLVWNEIVKE